MVAKSEAKEAAEAAPEKAPAPAAPAAPAAGRTDLRSWILALTIIVVAPAASWAVAQYVLLPRLRAQLNAPFTPAPPPEPDKDKGDGKGATPPTYEFSNVVVNLAGTMGTRYLKTSFVVTGADGLKGLFDVNKARLTDVTLNVLSSLTLADLEEPGSKNVLREKLVTAYNEALGRKVADQVYFSDFVVQ